MLRPIKKSPIRFNMVKSQPKHPLIVIIGATGTGKSKVRSPLSPLSKPTSSEIRLQLAVSLATRFGGEIINGDAMQMYEGLPIATNKLPTKDRKGVPHHLLGCIPIDDAPWTVEGFRSSASRVIDEVRGRGKLPILVGGTHYYVQSLVFKNSTLGSNEDLVDIEEQVKRWPILKASEEEMLAELRKVDPVMATRWHPNDRRHIRRSLEIWLTTGTRASDVYQMQRMEKDSLASQDASAIGVPYSGESEATSPFSLLFFWIHSSFEALKARLNDRVVAMIKEGLLEEVAAMHAVKQAAEAAGRSLDPDKGIWVSIGYKEFLPYLSATQSKDQDLESPEFKQIRLKCIEATQAHTRQYAKRQVRWIRLKLLHELRQQGVEKRLFLLDGTDLERWQENVERTALDLASKFMAGEPLPDSMLLSDAAEKILSRTNKEDDLIAMHCDGCQKTLMGDKQWDAHVRTKRHKIISRREMA